MPSIPGSGSRHLPFDISQRAALGILACALTALVYQRALDLPFVFDDLVTVLLNPSLADLGDVRAILFHDPPRAAVNLSYALDRMSWGFSSFGYHLTNFILHIIVVGLFYGVCTRALADGLRPESGRGRASPGSRSDPGSSPGVEWAAFFAAATFAVHPLMSATAAYVSARSELLCAVGMLAALLFARRAIVAPSVFAAAFAVLSGILAAASSGAAAALPIVILAYDVWVLREPGWKRRVWRAYLPAMAVIAVMAAWQLSVVLEADRVPPRGLVANLLTEAIVIWRYLGLMFLPVGQALVHQVRWAGSVDPPGLIALAGIGAAIAAAARARHVAPLAAFGAVWFFAALAATSTFVPLRDAMAEHRTYVPAAGLLIAAASLLTGPLSSSRAARGAAVCVLVVLSVLTYARQTVWADPLRMWEESVQRSPGAWQARLGYAEILREIGQCVRAIPEYEATLRLHSAQADAIVGLKRCRSSAE